MANANKLAGIAGEFTHRWEETNAEGKKVQIVKTYTLPAPNGLHKARFVTWLERRARESVFRSNDLPEDRYQEHLRAINKDIAACLYEWNGEVCVSALQTPKGMAKMVSILLQEQHPEVTEDFAESMIETKLYELYCILTEENGENPKAKAEFQAAVQTILSGLMPASPKNSA